MDEPRFPLLSIARLRMGIDGRGVTTLAAGAGCPLRCRWCINEKVLREGVPLFITAEELTERVRIDDLYFRATGGGITFGGGESLLHAGFIRRFREVCPPEWHISVETSLAVPEALLRTAIPAVDDFIVDCKDMDPDIYHRYTEGDPELMAANLKLLLASVLPERIRVRIPLIPEFNDREAQSRSAETLRSLGVEKIELFDYVKRV